MREGSTSLRALEEALRAAEEAGATTELLDLRELALPMYEPGRPLEEYGEGVERLVESMRGADAMIWSTAAYHGTLAGVTKNALDFAQFLARDERPYLQDRVVGLIATAGGNMAAVQRGERDDQRRPRPARRRGPALRAGNAVVEGVRRGRKPPRRWGGRTSGVSR